MKVGNIELCLDEKVPEGEVWLTRELDGSVKVHINLLTSIWARDADGKIMPASDYSQAPIMALHDNHIDRLHNLMGPKLEDELRQKREDAIAARMRG